MLGFAGTLLASDAGVTNYTARGVVREVRAAEGQVVIAHEEIPNFMGAMTMPFNVKDAAILTNVAAGEKIRFELHVSDSESWVDHVERFDGPSAPGGSEAAAPEVQSPPLARAVPAPPGRSKSPLRTFKFTNELGQPVCLEDFRGQAVALTFFFTRCPIPEFCPRLSRNFAEVQHKLGTMENAPTNWHLLSVTFDPAHDTPGALKAYAATYHYDPAHWSFLTGPADKIAELAAACDVRYDPDSGLFNHNFRTLIVDTSNHLQMVFPTSGDLSDGIVQELLKALGKTNTIEATKNFVRADPDQKPEGFNPGEKNSGNKLP